MPGRWRPRGGLRLRITAAIAGIVLVAVAALGLAVHTLLLLDRVQEARASADQEVRAATGIYQATGLLSFDARLGEDRLPLPLRALVRADGSRATYVEGGAVRTVWAAERQRGTVLSIRSQFRPSSPEVRAADRALVLAGTAVVVLASLVGALSASRLARRLRIAARTARGVAQGADPGSLRSAVGARRDEVGDLADAVDAMAEQLRARLVREQQFTADVAHDLRTPVTGLVTAAALLEESRAADLVRDRAAALTTLVEDLLEVARLDRGAEAAAAQRVDLADVVRSAIARGVAAGEYDDADVAVRTGDGSTLVVTDPRRVERVVANLVRNAVQHGGTPVRVEQRDRWVEVRDSGPGFAADLLAEGPRRFRRAPSTRAAGNGLGLVIAAGQADVLGAALHLGNAPEGGAVARLELPEGPPAGITEGITPGITDGVTAAVTGGSRDRDRPGPRR